MPRYLVEHAFPDGWQMPTDAPGAERPRRGEGRDAEECVTRLSSFVSDDKRRTFCVYDAPTPEAIRRTAARSDLPVERITRIRVLDPHPFA